MTDHKFSVGQQVAISIRDMSTGSLAAEIMRLMPSDGRELQYRVKCRTESYERVVSESMVWTSKLEAAAW